MLKIATAFIVAFFMALLETALGRLNRDECVDYVAYLVGVAAGRELYFDDGEALWKS